MLCVDLTKINTSKDVQKAIKLEDMLLNDLKDFDTVEHAFEANYAPISMCVSVRSVYSNLVLQRKTEDKVRYYVNFTNIPQYIHKGYDLMMYCTALGFMSCVNMSQEVDQLMMKSEVMPIGLYNPDQKLINPMVYSHIILDDAIIEDMTKHLRSEFRFVSIDEMNQSNIGNIPALLRTLVNVKKGENENGKSDNND